MFVGVTVVCLCVTGVCVTGVCVTGVCVCHIFIYSSLNERLSFFHVLAIVNAAAMNIAVRVSF